MNLGSREHQITEFLDIPDYVTLAGLVFGLSSIFASLQGHLGLATALIAAAVTCDFWDGRIARSLGRSGGFGVQLDGFSDIVTSILAVAVFGYCAGLDSPAAMAAMVLFATAGALRLSRFAITGTVEGYYEGMPVTCGLAIPLAYWLCLWWKLPVGWMPWLYVIPAFLMVSTIRVKKP
ncbi:MAG: CDP-alcohol phosphatidyltransferase family protein [Planctomycetes bacterium]|nr:CDP-alcohol phosphatidyltransferase family protein [Planctomycetota bacterium]